MTVETRGRVVTLSVQGFLLGLTSALLIVPVSAIFLARYGSSRLPYTYLAVAVLGAVVSLRIAGAVRRLSLIRLAVLTLSGAAVAYGASWVLLRTIDAVWTSFALWVVFPLQLQLGFVFIGSQAGRLLDVRQIKRYFPRVVFGFSAGFLVGGMGTIPLAGRVAAPDMLLLTTASGVALVVSFLISGRRYRSLLAVPDTSPRPIGTERRPGSILRNRYILLVFAYQVLSAAVAQVADFLAFDRAAARYAESDQLAGFAAVLTAAVNVADILFLALVAGFIMTRFGLRAGLMVNPVATAMLTAVMLVIGASTGAGATTFFLLAAITRTLNIVLTDGTTRTSVNATYQAVAPERRFAAQTAVEGIGVPVGLGLVGVLLIVVDALGAGAMAVTAAMGVLCAAWLVCGVAVFGDYRRNLAVRIRRRQVAPIDLEYGDPETVRVAIDLVASPDLARVRIGLDILEAAGDARLPRIVTGLLAGPDPSRIVVGLERLRNPLPAETVTAVTGLLRHRDAAVRSVAAGVLCRAGQSDQSVLLLVDPEPEVRWAAAAALRAAGAGVRAEAVLRTWAGSADVADRHGAARVLGGAGALTAVEASLLLQLRRDSNPSVRIASVGAATLHPESDLAALLAGPIDARLGPPLARLLGSRGDAAAEVVAAALRGEGPAAALPRWRLARACTGFTPEVAAEVLEPVLADPDPELRHAARITLLESGWRGESGALDHCLDLDRERAVVLLGTLAVLSPIDPDHLLVRSLAEALVAHSGDVAAAADLTVTAPVAMRWREVVRSASVDAAIAEEAIEVTFRGERRRLLIALVRPGVAAGDRLALLGVAAPEPEAALRRLIDGGGAGIDPWLRVCAVWWLAAHPQQELRPLVADLTRATSPVVAETAIAALAAF